ncbi:MAG: pro-sigmaK processing inhibitor BofA family protein [Clostridia bacterium]
MPGGIVTYIVVLLVLFLVFKVFSLSMKLFFKLLINAVIGALILIVFNFFGDVIFGFVIEINWLTALITGLLGVPGVILIIIIKLITG